MKKTLGIAIAIIVFSNCKKTNVSHCCDGNPQVAAVDSCVIAVPDIFTPNSDGVNDIQYVCRRNIASMKFTITKKSGKVVFESTDMNLGWDGMVGRKYQKEKEYEFKVVATTVNGQTLSLEGSFCMIRDNCAKGNLDLCCFGNQWNGGTFDLSRPSGEIIKECN